VFAATLILPWLESLRREFPGVEIFDAHTHIGEHDPDGFRCDREELVAALAEIDARGVVFPMHEPDGYPPANDMVMREAAASEDRLFPFCCVDPESDPAAEAERCLDAGARGVKLHPRAEGFTLDHPGLQGVFALANERRVPVLTHAGRGIPALGRHAVDACERYPEMHLILAHAGISDLGWIAEDAAKLDNLFFDTAWWNVADHLQLYATIPPGRILYASDMPYGPGIFAAFCFLRVSRAVGLGPEALRAIAGGQLARIVAGDDPADLGPPPGVDAVGRRVIETERVVSYCSVSLQLAFRGFDPSESISLARLACQTRRDGTVGELLHYADRLLSIAQENGQAHPEIPYAMMPATLLAMVIAGTPEVGAPPIAV